MKEHNKIAAAGLLLGILTFFVINLLGCDTTAKEVKGENLKIENAKDNKQEKHSCCTEEKTESFTENSIYQLDAEWTTETGNKFELSELKGKPVVLTMFFASCTYACPILVNDVKKIEASLPRKQLTDYQFILVSIDPERDTPAALNQLAEKNNLDLKRWKLLTGNPENIMELAALIGFKYVKTSDGQYSHSNLITILNEEGEIIHQHKGLNKDVAQAVNVLSNIN